MKKIYIISGANGAGKLMLNRINRLLEESHNFAFETTLASKSFLKYLEKAYEKLVKFKKEKNSPLVVSENGKIVFISPDNIPLKAKNSK